MVVPKVGTELFAKTGHTTSQFLSQITPATPLCIFTVFLIVFTIFRSQIERLEIMRNGIDYNKIRKQEVFSETSLYFDSLQPNMKK